MNRLMQALRSYRTEAILGPGLKLLEAVFELLVPLVVANAIDLGIKCSDVHYITKSFLLLLALGIVGFICSVTAQYFAAKASVGTSTKVRQDLYIQIGKLSFSDLDRIGVSSLITRLNNDMNQVQNGLNLALRLLLRSPFVVVGAMVMALTIDVFSALVFLCVIVLLGGAVYLIMRVSVPAFRSVQDKVDLLTQTTRENLIGTRVIRAFQMEENQNSKYQSLNNSLSISQQRAGRISALMNPVTYVILNLGIVCLLWLSGAKVNTGSLTPGETVALYNYMTQILVELVKFANLVVSISKASSSMRRINEIFSTKPGMSYSNEIPVESRTAPNIEFKSVSLRYHEKSELALSDISFSIKSGETVGIIGGTGAGKTSLANLIMRFYDVTNGEVLINGVDVRDYPSDQLRNKIGYVLQRSNLMAGTLKENIICGLTDITDEEIMDALKISQSEDILVKKENGLDATVEQNGRNYSGGQKQRLTIARALVRKPEILILDDSTSSLDLLTEAHLKNALKSLSFHPTTLIITQRTSTIKDADLILVLDDGRLVGTGTHDVLLKTCPIYREIDESQRRGGE